MKQKRRCEEVGARVLSVGDQVGVEARESRDGGDWITGGW